METIDIVDPRATMVKKRAPGYAIRPKGFPTIRIFPSRPLPGRMPVEGVADRSQAEPGVCGPDLRRGKAAAADVHVLRCGSTWGVRKRAVLSTGERIERNRRDWGEIRKQQRKVSRCQRRSNRRRKRVRRLAATRFRERVRSRNACHRATTRIVREHGLIAVEKLNIQGMTKKGLNKKGLNREILTQSWGLLRNQLQYKAEWAGREFVEVNAESTSQDCHRCGTRNKPGSSETYRCASCGLKTDRDHNAAINILRAGVTALGAGTWADGPSVAPELCTGRPGG